MKAADAASKFVERPEGNLLPVASGTMQAQSSQAAGSSSAAPVIEPAVNLAAEQKSKPRAAVSGPKYTGEPVSVNLKDVDLKDFFPSDSRDQRLERRAGSRCKGQA